MTPVLFVGSHGIALGLRSRRPGLGSLGCHTPVMGESNVEIARRGFEAALAGDIDALGEILSPDVRWHGGDPDAEGSCRNRADALAVMSQAFDQGFTAELVDVVGIDDRVVVILRPAGSGRTVANMTTFRDGRVVEMVHFPRPSAALAAAGL